MTIGSLSIQPPFIGPDPQQQVFSQKDTSSLLLQCLSPRGIKAVRPCHPKPVNRLYSFGKDTIETLKQRLENGRMTIQDQQALVTSLSHRTSPESIKVAYTGTRFYLAEHPEHGIHALIQKILNTTFRLPKEQLLLLCRKSSWTDQDRREALDLLRQNPLLVWARHARGDTALFSALLHHNRAAIRLLLDAGADIIVADRDGNTPLHWAAWHGKRDMIQSFYESGADMTSRIQAGPWKNQTPLYRASENGQLGVVTLLLKLTDGAAINDAPYRGHTPLHIASVEGHFRVAEALLEAGASVTAKDFWGSTPLHFAAENGNLRLIKHMVEKAGATIFATNNDQKTPLDWAIEKGDPEVIDYLRTTMSRLSPPSNFCRLM